MTIAVEDFRQGGGGAGKILLEVEDREENVGEDEKQAIYVEQDDEREFAVEGAAFDPCAACGGSGEADKREVIPDEEWQESIEYLVECMRTGVVARLHEEGRILPRARFALSQLKEFLIEKGY